MTLESQIQQFIDHAKPGDAMLLSKDGDLQSCTGLALLRIPMSFGLFDGGTKVVSLNLLAPPTMILKEALLWSYRTGRELATPDPDPTIRDQLMQRCYRRGMDELDAKPLLRGLLEDLATWLDQRHGGSSQTADLLRAIQP